MQVSVEKTSELSRKMTVSLPDDVLQEKMDARFKSLAREVKLDGFRPGKVPIRVVKKMYSDRVRGEVSGDLIQSSYFEALEEQKLVPAGQPHIHPVDKDTGFEYTAEFEIYPEFSLDALPLLEITRPVGSVEQADQDSVTEKLREQKITWNDADRASKKGDRIVVHFSGVCEGENFTDGQVKDHAIEIGSNTMIPGFENELTDLSAADNKTFTLTFPDDYGNKDLAGKDAEFEVEVVKVEEGTLPEIDEEFIKAYGIKDGTIDSFNKDVKSNMEKELTQGIKTKLKKSVMDSLYEKIQITVPKALIDQEVQTMMKPYHENAKTRGTKIEDLDLPTDVFEEQATRRVALGLILSEIIKSNDIKIDDDKVRTTVEEMASSYESPDEFVSWYYADEKRLNEIKQVVLEEQVVDWIVDQAKVTDEAVCFNDIIEKTNG